MMNYRAKKVFYTSYTHEAWIETEKRKSTPVQVFEIKGEMTLPQIS